MHLTPIAFREANHLSGVLISKGENTVYKQAVHQELFDIIENCQAGRTAREVTTFAAVSSDRVAQFMNRQEFGLSAVRLESAEIRTKL